MYPRIPEVLDYKIKESFPSYPCSIKANECKKKSGVLSLRIWPSSYMHCACSVTKLCPTLCDPIDCSPPGSTVHGILQARILEWVVMPFSRGSSQPRDRTPASCIAGRFLTKLRGKPVVRADVLFCRMLAALTIIKWEQQVFSYKTRNQVWLL